jgi:hypothetical protein
MKPIDDRATMKPAPQTSAFVEVRGPSGRLYGKLDPQTMVMEFRDGRQVEWIDLSAYRQTPRPPEANGD